MYRKSLYDSPIGRITFATDDDSLVGLWLEGSKYFGGSVRGEMEAPADASSDDDGVIARVRDWLDRYFAGEQPDPKELPLDPAGSGFRQEVWKILQEIPYGEVVTYGAIASEIAERRGKPTMSSQAVGGAVGHNPISIIIPCHRVIGSDHSLTGYASGLGHKIALLELEGVDTSIMTIPTRGTAL